MRLAVAAAALVAAVSVSASGQSPGGRTLLVTSDFGLHLQAWRPGAAGFEQVWEATPRAADADFSRRRQEIVPVGRDGPMLLSDCDGDGRDELVLVDGFGVTVYGASPAYYPFEKAGSRDMAVGDVDGDGAAEFITQSNTDKGREIEVWRPAASALTKVSEQVFEGFGRVLLWADVDNDGAGELVTAGETMVQVLEKGDDSPWTVVAEVPSGGTVVSVRSADLDGDGKRELLVLGTEGKITVYKHRKPRGRDTFAVFWQSGYLITPGLRPQGNQDPSAFPASLATADVDADGQEEVLVGMREIGLLPDEDKPAASMVYVFDFDGRHDLAARWTARPTAGEGAIAAGDLDGDGAADWTTGGREVHSFDKAANAFRPALGPCPDCRDAVIGELPELREPAGAARIVPLYWNVLNRRIVAGKPARVELNLYSPWAEARDVQVTVTAPDASIAVAGGLLKIASIPARGVVTAPPFTLTGKGAAGMPILNIEISAAGGYRQTVPVRLYVVPAPPNYEAADVEERIAAARARAKDDNRRVLVVWGGREHKASQDFLEGVLGNREVSGTLLNEYEIVRVEAAAASKLAAKYGADLRRGGLPHVTILDADGNLVADQPPAAFRKGEAFDAKVARDFLVRHQPAHLNAETIFDEALGRAKKEQKTLFVWFGAPW